MKSSNRNLLRWLIILIGSIVTVFSIGVLLSIYIEDKIDAEIFSLNGKTSSVKVSLFTRSVTVKDLKWDSVPDSTNCNQHSLQLKTISVNGISLYDLIFNNTLLVNDVLLDSGKFLFNKNIKQYKKKTTNSKQYYFSFNHIYLNNIETLIKADTIVNFSAFLNCHFRDADIKIDSINNLTYSVKTVEAFAEKINFNRQEGVYGGTIAQIYLNTQKQKITIDSALLIPNSDKYEFARHLGKQTARINLSIPQLIIEGIKFEEIIDSAFVASKIEIKSFDLFSFKDKRVPFLRRKNIPLPMEVFLKLPVKVKVDSIIIINSHIAIEEFPENGNEPGTVTFDDVNATFIQLNNRLIENDDHVAVLEATGFLMGSGKIQASFQFPLDGSSVYNARGSISKMPLTKLNQLLTSKANIRVESGYLNNLVFNFDYTDLTSKGRLEIEYEDLRITSLNKQTHFTNEIKTMFINAAVKNNKNKSLALSKRTGIIDIERDRKRFIFNVWVKSILDGLKSSIFETNKINRESKKS